MLEGSIQILVWFISQMCFSSLGKAENTTVQLQLTGTYSGEVRLIYHASEAAED